MQRIIMPKTTGQRLRWARRKKGWSMDRLSERAGVSSASICKYECDKQSPTFYTAQCLAEELGVSLDWLACRTENVEVCNAGNYD